MTMTPEQRAAISLNNAGVTLLQLRCYQQGFRTLRDAVGAMSAASHRIQQQHGSTGDDNSSSRETGDDNSSSRETSDDNSSSRETGDDNSSSRETGDDNSSSRETVDDNSSSRETLCVEAMLHQAEKRLAKPEPSVDHNVASKYCDLQTISEWEHPAALLDYPHHDVSTPSLSLHYHDTITHVAPFTPMADFNDKRAYLLRIEALDYEASAGHNLDLQSSIILQNFGMAHRCMAGIHCSEKQEQQRGVTRHCSAGMQGPRRGGLSRHYSEQQEQHREVTCQFSTGMQEPQRGVSRHCSDHIPARTDVASSNAHLQIGAKHIFTMAYSLLMTSCESHDLDGNLEDTELQRFCLLKTLILQNLVELSNLLGFHRQVFEYNSRLENIQNSARCMQDWVT
jgi:hypothetical protein